MAGAWIWLALLASPQQDDPVPPPPVPATERPAGRGGRLFISPMGEPFRGGDPIKAWFDGADADHDGVVTAAEFVADADRFFALLDRAHDGEIDPDDIEYYETMIAPEIRTGGGGDFGGGERRGGGGGGGGRRGGGGGRGRGGGGYGGGRGRGGSGEAPAGGTDGSGDATAAAIGTYDAQARGAARFSFFGFPEPVTAADTNLNRGVDITEFRNAARRRFALLDKRGDGRLTRAELPGLSIPPDRRVGSPRGFGGRRPGGGGTPPGRDGGDE